MTSIPKPSLPRRRSLFRNLFVDNPMLDEAIRARRRFRRGGANAGPGLYYSVIGLIVLAYAWSLVSIIHSNSNVTEEICYFELAMVTLIMPLSVFAAIAGEREKATWEALVLTSLTPGQILAGKLTWRITSLLTIMAILSVQIIVGEAIRPQYGLVGTIFGQVIVFTWGVLLGAMTLFISTVSKRGVAALGITGVVLLTSLVVVPMLSSLFGVYFGEMDGNRDMGSWSVGYVLSWILSLHPFVCLDRLIHGLPVIADSPSDTDSQNGFLFIGRYVPTAPVAYLVTTVMFVALAYRMLRKLEAPQETERDIRIRFRQETGPGIAIGAVTAVAFCLLTYKISDGDVMLVAGTTVVGFILGALAAWFVSRGGKIVPRMRRQ